jgi:hypothetical protein
MERTNPTPPAAGARAIVGLCARTLLVVTMSGAATPCIAEAQDSSNRPVTVQSVTTGGTPVPILAAVRLAADESIHLDGRLDEEAWGRARSASGFRQKDPIEDADPSEETEVRVLLTSDDLYIGAMLYDDPDRILAFQKRRDAYLSTDDRFMVVLDTFLDGRTGYYFETNPAGLMGDALIGGSGGGRGGGGPGGFGGRGTNRAWDGIWDVRTARTPDGWSVEMRIPFRTLNFDPELDVWGINFQRTIRRRREEIQWSGHRRNQQLTQPINAGRLTGLGGMSQGVGLEVKPYVTGSWKNVPEELDPTTYPSNIGGDISYNITPGLRAGLSINTDFAEVEVDDRRVNLTRFPLRFEERRDFFLEGSSVYSFAPRSGPSPYYSRRIGLVEGEQIPIRYGLRLGGQTGRYEIGFLHISTEGQSIIPQEDFTVARFKRNLFLESSVGILATRRSTGADSMGVRVADRYTVGVDANLVTSQLFGDKRLEFEAFFVYNSDPEPGIEKRSLGELTARGFRFNYPNDVWEGHLSYREFGSYYNPAVGFVERNDFRRVEPRIAWNPRTDGISWLRRFRFDLQYRYLEGLDVGLAQEEEWDFGILGMDFESGEDLSLDVTRLYERLDGAFEISDGVVVEPGEYTNWSLSLRGRTASQRRASVRVEASTGGFWNGTRDRLELSASFRPTPGLNLTTAYELNDVALPQGDFTTNLARVEGGWDVTPLLSFNGSVQYDDVSEVVGLFAKIHWILQPGNDLFFVYTHNWLRRAEDFGPGLTSTLSRGATIKANYTFRL